MTTTKTLNEEWKKLDAQRADALDRAFLHAQYTIPRLFPRRYFEGTTSTYDLPELYASLPGMNVMKLSSTIVNALLPPNDLPPFELVLSPELTEDQKEALRDPLHKVERLTLDMLQVSNLRETLFLAAQHAVSMGDSLIHQTAIDSYKVYHPSQFLIRRDGDGKIKEYWTLDWVVTDLLEPDLKNLNGGKPMHQRGEHEPLISKIYMQDGKWTVDREFRDSKYDTGKTYDVLPYYHIGWTPVAGEDYSRSLVEENFGTIRALEWVSQALAEGLRAGSEGRIIVNSAGPTTADDIGDTNWSIISARPEDLSTFQPQVSNTIGVALESVRYYSQVLNDAFMSSSVSELRGDRVTAFQTSQLVNEKTLGLSGVLANIEQNIEQLVRRVIHLLVKENKIMAEFKDFLDDGGLTISIASGLEALGKQADALRIESMLNISLNAQVPEMLEVLNFPNLMQGYARSSGLDMDQYTYNDRQIAERRQDQQQQQLEQQVTSQAVESGGKVIEQQLGNA